MMPVSSQPIACPPRALRRYTGRAFPLVFVLLGLSACSGPSENSTDPDLKEKSMDPSAGDTGGSSGSLGGSKSTGGSGNDGSGGSATGGSAAGGTGGSGSVIGMDWPAAPIIAADAPGDLTSLTELFSGSPQGANCVVEPQAGTMLPQNWLRPRFRVQGTAMAYQITLSSDAMANDLVGYGGPNGFVLPQEYWDGVAQQALTAPVLIAAVVRVYTGAGFSESTTNLSIAPVQVGGSVMYLSAKTSKDHVDSARLKGFDIGDQTTEALLRPADVSEADIRGEIYDVKSNAATEWANATGAASGKASCIGCHTSTPDGLAVAFNDGYPGAGLTASLESGTQGARASGVTDRGARLLMTPFIGSLSFSLGHYSGGDRRAVSTFTPWVGGGPYGSGRNLSTAADLVWVNLEAQGSASLGIDGPTANAAFMAELGAGWGYISRNGDPGAAANPDWNEAGDLIAYASVARVAGGHVGGIKATVVPKTPDVELSENTEADLYTVPYNQGAGGIATPVSGASEPGIAEYYPDFSPDSEFLSFNRAGSTAGYIYYRADGEINAIPTSGGTAHRLAANDPPACTGESSPGVINSWPKWSASYETVGSKTYYWIIFSSARDYSGKFLVPPASYTPTTVDRRSSQIYLSAVVVEGGVVTSYPGLYVWNQETDASNLMPSWGGLRLP